MILFRNKLIKQRAKRVSKPNPHALATPPTPHNKAVAGDDATCFRRGASSPGRCRRLATGHFFSNCGKALYAIIMILISQLGIAQSSSALYWDPHYRTFVILLPSFAASFPSASCTLHFHCKQTRHVFFVVESTSSIYMRASQLFLMIMFIFLSSMYVYHHHQSYIFILIIIVMVYA